MPLEPLTCCTAAQCRELLLSLRLLGDEPGPDDKVLACLYAVAKRPEAHYRIAELPKRGGGVRRLHVPDPLLRGIQRNLLHRVLDGMHVPPCATAYRRGGGILLNAAPHVGRPVVLRLDLRDFFDSITFPMVYAHAFPGVYFPAPVRALLTSLCCLGDRLPQGAPTSAAVSNLVLAPFDRYMAAWCAAQNISYTRYCDDMTFSGDFEPQLVTHKAASFLHELGFALNQDKTKYLTHGMRQTVTGVVVNEKPQAPASYRRALRQALYYCEKHGVTGHLQRIGVQQDAEAYLRKLLGRIGYVLQLNPNDAQFREAQARAIAMLRESRIEDTLRLAQATLSDCAEIYAMQKAAFAPLLQKYKDYETNPGSETVEKITARMLQPETTYFFIMQGQIKLGVIRIVSMPDHRRRISPLFLLPFAQGHGYARKAMLLAEARYPDAAGWQLDTIKEERKLCKLYEKLGYHKTGKETSLQEHMTLVDYEK